MNNKTQNTPISKKIDIEKLMNVFDDDQPTEKIHILLNQHTPETKEATARIDKFMEEYIQKISLMQSSKEAKIIVRSDEFRKNIQETAINEATKHVLIKYLTTMLKMCAEKHWRFINDDIIGYMLSLGENIHQKKTIIALIINEIKKYVSKKQYTQAYIIAKELNIALEYSYGEDHNKIAKIRFHQVGKILHEVTTKRESQIKYMQFDHAKKLFEEKQYEKAEKIFKKIIRPEHHMRSDISSKELIKNLDTLLTQKEKDELPRKMREDGKTVQIPSEYLKKYLEKELSLDRAVLSTTSMIYRDMWKMPQNKLYMQPQQWLSTLRSAIENYLITKIIDNKDGNIELVFRDAYWNNKQLDHTTINQIYDYLKQIEQSKQS